MRLRYAEASLRRSPTKYYSRLTFFLQNGLHVNTGFFLLMLIEQYD